MTPARRRYAPLAAALAALAVLAAVRPLAGPLLLANVTASLPAGLYLRAPADPPDVGAIVAVRPPPAARARLDRLGFPPEAPLLKRVGAQAGDRVCAAPGALWVNGETLPVRARDGRGEPLPVWRGCRALGPAELFLLGDSPDSFDSRAFGPVDRSSVIGVFAAVRR